MSIDVVYPGRSPAIGGRFELEVEELYAMKFVKAGGASGGN
jgi:hypothetical protein